VVGSSYILFSKPTLEGLCEGARAGVLTLEAGNVKDESVDMLSEDGFLVRAEISIPCVDRYLGGVL
jgi:hypothetical protein